MKLSESHVLKHKTLLESISVCLGGAAKDSDREVETNMPVLDSQLG
jgi:hypothetical protein